VEPGREFTGVAGWEANVPLIASQLDHRLRAEPTIEMIVEQNLGQ